MRAHLKPGVTLALSGIMAVLVAGLGGCASPQPDDALQFSFDGTTFAPPMLSPESASWAGSSDTASGPIEYEREWAQRTYTLRSGHADARM